ncbi:peptidase aspartic, active site protein [Purpureocillium lavendulum]|uniref:Peptidase aspartic, active site protein n=1 Tax=Purpureocillium lavendulum TaxID=1247861 RepID=A0AB34G521_9HYPO|nr:peptidase aspartic, active site protein [Purpureocillium lavendulum]
MRSSSSRSIPNRRVATSTPSLPRPRPPRAFALSPACCSLAMPSPSSVHAIALLGLGLSLLASTASAAGGTVAVPVVRRAHDDDDDQNRPAPLPLLARRGDGASTTPLGLDALNNITGGGYYADFDVGTPPQKLAFLLDTGSSDTWVNSVRADLCNDRDRQSQQQLWCQTPFNPNASSSFTTVARGGFNITYLDRRNIQGDYFKDTLAVHGKQVKNQQLGLALRTVRPTGILGLGYSAAVATNMTYPTVVDNMVSQGLIDAAVFSLYLNDADAKSGTILFGGVDTQKYYGSLATLPLARGHNASEPSPYYAVTLRGLAVDGVALEDLQGATAILDSGSSLTLLPARQAKALHDKFGVVSLEQLPVPLVDCAYRGDKGKATRFRFKFDNKTIGVPMDEMVLDYFPADAQKILMGDALKSLFGTWKSVCVFGVASALDYGVRSDAWALLGDPFLRSAYVVYDMANRQVGLAQANVNSDKSNVVAVKKGATALPDVAGVAEPSAAAQLAPSSYGVSAAALLMAVAAVLTTL